VTNLSEQAGDSGQGDFLSLLSVIRSASSLNQDPWEDECLQGSQVSGVGGWGGISGKGGHIANFLR
jgi:hypothetical protein